MYFMTASTGFCKKYIFLQREEWDLCCEGILVSLLNFFAMLLAGLLSLGYSTPFLSVGSTYMYTSLSVAKQAVLAIGEEIKSSGLPPEICPLIFVFTGKGNGNAPLMKNISLPELLLIAYIEILTLMHLYFIGRWNNRQSFTNL